MLALVVRMAGLAIAEIDYPTDTIRLTSEAATLLGLSNRPLTVPRSTIHAMFHPEDRASLPCENQYAARPKLLRQFSEAEHRIVRPDGQIRWFNSRKHVEFEGGKPIHSLLAILDITDRKAYEAHLRRNHDTFYALIQNNPFGVYVVDADFRLKQVSVGTRKVFENVDPLLDRDFAEVLQAISAADIR